MRWYEWLALSAGGIISLEAARRTVWQWLKSLVRGIYGVVKFGQAIPDLSALPGVAKRLETQHEVLRAEVIAARQDLKDHMTIEDQAALTTEKAWASLIAGQSAMVVSVADLRHELNTVRQIVMNQVELGSGDRWRLTHHHEDIPE